MSDALALPSGDFGAYLFDLDGTLVDNMPRNYAAWNRLVSEAGGQLTEELFYAWGGLPLAEVIARLNAQFGISMDPVRAVARKAELDLVDPQPPAPVSCVLAHVLEAEGRIPLAVVSGSSRKVICQTLRALDILEYFDAVVGSEDYTSAKPAPEPFLVAADRLGVAPAACLVFEDADFGIESAMSAGMSWVRVPRRP